MCVYEYGANCFVGASHTHTQRFVFSFLFVRSAFYCYYFAVFLFYYYSLLSFIVINFRCGFCCCCCCAATTCRAGARDAFGCGFSVYFVFILLHSVRGSHLKWNGRRRDSRTAFLWWRSIQTICACFWALRKKKSRSFQTCWLLTHLLRYRETFDERRSIRVDGI